MARPTFPLRLRDDRLRDLVRMVAEREGISQNELLEQAAEHEVLARGALLADELEASAAQLRNLRAKAMTTLVEASVQEFVEAEARTDPLRPRRIERPDESASAGSIGAVAAFRRR